jgi:hypothetical protein
MLPCVFLTAALSAGQTGDKGAEQPDLGPTPAAAAAPSPDTTKASAAAPPPDRWILMKALQGTWPGALLDGNRMQLTGWVDMSYTASTDTQTNLPIGFNHRANEFLLQQNWVRFERTVVTSGTTEPTFGFRSDWILPGADYRFTTANGLFSDQLVASDGRPNLYGVDPIAFYAEGYFPTVCRGLDIKVGRFFAQVGVESNEAPSNALFSHAYTFIYNPFTNTGALAILKLTDAWSVQAGLVLGNDVFIDPAARPTFTGSVKWAPPSQRDSLAFNTIVGPRRYDARHGQNNLDVFDLIYTHKFNPQLNYTFEALFSFQTDVPELGTITSLGVANYLTYTFTPRLSGTTRLEFFNDPQGQRTGFAGLYTAFTAGLSFQPLKAITVRPELRYDYNGQSAAFEDKHRLFTAAADVILRW